MEILPTILEDVVPGDSGGPIFDKEGCLVGLISGGSTEFQFNENNVPWTGPGQGPSAASIAELIQMYSVQVQFNFYSPPNN